MRCFIYGAGEYPATTPIPDSRDLVIAADGGLNALGRAGREADVIVGDFDSLGYVPAGDRVITLPEKKDITDMEAGVRLGLERGADSFVILGGDGGRPDHTYANYQLLWRLADRGLFGVSVGSRYCVSVVPGGSSLTFSPGMTGGLALFALGEEVRGICLTGAEYPLCGATLSPMDSLGVSNRLTGEGGTLTPESGRLMVMWEHGEKFFFPS